MLTDLLWYKNKVAIPKNSDLLLFAHIRYLKTKISP